MALFSTTMNCQSMVDRNSVVMDDFEVEDAMIHFFTIYGMSIDGVESYIFPKQNKKLYSTNSTFWKLVLRIYGFILLYFIIYREREKGGYALQ